MSKHPKTYPKKKPLPRLVYADETGRIFDFAPLAMCGRSAELLHPLAPDDLIPLPEGSELFVMPQRAPIGWDDEADEMIAIEEDPCSQGKKVFAVAAFVSPAHTQTAMAAFAAQTEGLKPLPLFAYTAVGWADGRFWAACFRSDPDIRQDLAGFNLELVRKKTIARLKKEPENRLIQHLGRCSLTYGCPAAKNLFLERFEAPLPTSPVCNARCLGCISFQSPDGPPATQDRITFVPTPEEVTAIAVPHLQKISHSVVSFGQGCEGEPLLQVTCLEDSIRLIRKQTASGTVNLNSNSSLPAALERLIAAGLDSLRISLNSVRKPYYEAYYRPNGYTYEDVLESWRLMKQNGRFVSLNLFVTPGLTDEREEIERLCGLIEELGLDMIQLRNHNIDIEWYLKHIGFKRGCGRMGVRNMAKYLKGRFPTLRLGYFNPALR